MFLCRTSSSVLDPRFYTESAAGTFASVESWLLGEPVKVAALVNISTTTPALHGIAFHGYQRPWSHDALFANADAWRRARDSL